MFSLGKSFIIFSEFDVSSQILMSLRLYPIFFLNFMASGNLQRSIISRVNLKIPSLSLKNVLYFCFSFSVMSFVFLP